MGICNQGLSGGLPVYNQQGNVTLSNAGDYAVIVLSNPGLPAVGGDNSGSFVLSGSFQNVVISVNYVPNVSQWGGAPAIYNQGQNTYVGQNANWQFLQNCVRYDNNTYITGPFTPTSATALQIGLGFIQGFYAVQLKLVSISSGSMLVAGSTQTTSSSSTEPMILQAIQAQSAYLKAMVLGLSDMNNQDYAAPYGLQL
jgi:hypothetical protein